MTRHEPPSPPLSQLALLAQDLDLTALADALPSLLTQAEQQSPSYTDFALALLHAERNARQERKLGRSLKRSRLGTVEGLDGFDFAARPQLEPRVVRELLSCRFVLEKRNLILAGPPGRGKTRCAKAIAHAACIQGYSTLFTNTAEMLEDIHAAHADGSFKRTLRRYVKPAVLLADEFGYEPFERHMATYLFRVVSARHGVGSTILTTNTGFSKWTSLFPSEAEAVATVDRLVDRATILRFTGKSFRNPNDVHGAPLD